MVYNETNLNLPEIVVVLRRCLFEDEVKYQQSIFNINSVFLEINLQLYSNVPPELRLRMHRYMYTRYQTVKPRIPTNSRYLCES